MAFSLSAYSNAYVVACTPNGAATWDQRTILSGRDYLITFLWLQRDGHWWMNLADQAGNPIKSGIKLVANIPLLRTFSVVPMFNTAAPPGEFVMYDSLSQGLDPGFSDLGSAAFPLVYLAP